MLDRKRRATALSAVVLIVCGAFSGCSSNSDDQGAPSQSPTASGSPAASAAGTPAASTAPDSGVVVQGNVTLTGAETVNGDFNNNAWTVQPTCADAAAHGSGGGGFGPDGAFLIPGPYPDGSVLTDGTDYITNLQIAPDKFKGPGTYTDIAQGIQVGGQENGYYYDFTLAGTSTATVKADGSGSLEFTGVPAKTAPAQMISGKITWTCSGS
jgi:hypothetical protein